jgi:hypothetical protein
MPGRNPIRRTTRLPRLLDRVVQQRRAAAPEPEVAEVAAGEPDEGRRLEALADRVAHLEALVEGLQDSIHRDAVRRDRILEEIKETTEPATMMRSLERHSREQAL